MYMYVQVYEHALYAHALYVILGQYIIIYFFSVHVRDTYISEVIPCMHAIYIRLPVHKHQNITGLPSHADGIAFLGKCPHVV